MRELVEYICKLIVDNPDQVKVTEVRSGEGVIIRVEVAPDDVGKVVGKQGQIAKAVRSLLRVVAVRSGVRAVLEITG